MNIHTPVAIRLPRYSLLLLFTFPVLLLFAHPASSHPLKKVSLAHEIEVSVDPGKRLLTGIDRVCCFDADDREVSFTVGSNITVEKVLFMEKEIEAKIADASSYDAKIITLNLSPENFTEEVSNKGALVFTYRGAFPGFEGATAEIKRGISFINTGVIGEEGAFLPSTSGWHPVREGRTATFDVRVTTPSAYNAVMEGDWVSSSEEGGKRVNRWVSRESLDGINLTVSKFVIEEDSHKGIKLYTFFFKEDKALSKVYFDKIKEYLDIYAEIFPPYPYGKFAVVESLLPTGYGMPSYTLLGSNIIRLPFIPDTSLGHELVHNWWGNSVFIDPVYGNWAEALTTYTADHLYKERAGEGEAYRRQALESYRNYAGSVPVALKEFRFETTTWGRAVGYNKGSFVFHMLRRLVGDELFYASLKRFYEDNKFTFTSTQDIQKAFEEETGRELNWFFYQWFIMRGGPSLSLTDVALTEEKGGGYRISFTLDQGNEAYILKIPVLIRTVGGVVSREIDIVKERQRVEITLSKKPLSIKIDPGLDLFRLLSYRETPPLLASFFGAGKGSFVMPPSGEFSDRYAPVVSSLSRDYGQRVIEAGEAHLDESPEKHGFFIFGGPNVNPLFKRYWNAPSEDVSLEGNLFTIKGESFDITRNVVVVAFRDREDGEKVHVVFIGTAGEEVMRSIPKRIPHLTSKGYLVFKASGGLLHGSLVGEELLRFDFD